MQKLKIGDKVKVLFESGNRLTGTILRELPNGHYAARFGRGDSKFCAAIYWASWDAGVHFSWKESSHVWA